MDRAVSERLLERLGVRFEDETLLEQALSHRSFGARHYERLEFLGDGLLNFVIAAELFRRCEHDDEGALSRLRASLVRESTLAGIARELDLGAHLNLGTGELRSGGFDRASILADAVESIVGAVYLDQGFDAARDLVLGLFGKRLDELPAAEDLKDPKTRLQELLQGAGLERPEYEVIDEQGKAHERSFTVRCRLPSSDLEVSATARSRRKAEQGAAAAMLERRAEFLPARG